MADRNEKYLKPLREVCNKLVVEEKSEKHIEDLRNFYRKGAFYEYYVFAELLEVLTKHPELHKKKLTQIFELFHDLFNEQSSKKDSLINLLYNFIIKHKV